MRLRFLVTVCCITALSHAALAGFDVRVSVLNNTGSTRTDWPVFLTVYRVFGGNFDQAAINPDGFHVYNPSETEMPHMYRPLPPYFSRGNDEIIFVIPSINSGETQVYRVTNTGTPGLTNSIDLLNSPYNMIANAGFETDTDGMPDGFSEVFSTGASITCDTSEKHSGSQSLLLTFKTNETAELQMIAPISFSNGRYYYYSFWAKTENMARQGGTRLFGGGYVSMDNDRFNGRNSIPLSDTREWYCYKKFPAANDPRDAWGVERMCVVATSTGGSVFRIGGFQEAQAFLTGDGTGRVWIDDVLLFRQPSITVDRAAALTNVQENGAVVFSRPVNMPGTRAFPQEAADSLSAFAMRGERRQLRFGVHAVQPLTNITVTLSPLVAPMASIGTNRLDLEFLQTNGWWDFTTIEPYTNPVSVRADECAEFILGIDVPMGIPSTVYTGSVTLVTNGAPLKTLPLALHVLPMDVPSMTNYMIGGIFNIYIDPGTLKRNTAFYRQYGKCRFNYMMLFDYFICEMHGSNINYAGALQQAEEMRTIGHVTDYIGLYREPNMSEDQPRKWYQIADGRPDYLGSYTIGTSNQFKQGYQNLATAAHDYAATAIVQKLLYMVSDEPSDSRDVNPAMGWLNDAITNAITVSDAQFDDMVQTWQWYNLPILDDPADWSGPLVYNYVKANEGQFGICGSSWDEDSARYQPGLMMAASGARLWHYWHAGDIFLLSGSTNVVRRRYVAAEMGAGMNDLRYYVELKRRIASSNSPLAAKAQAYLDGVFTFVTADHDRTLLPYNEVPWRWGYDRFYDDWRRQMKDYILALESGFCLLVR